MATKKTLKKWLDVNDDEQFTTVDIFTWGLLLFFSTLMAVSFLITPLKTRTAALEHLINLHNIFSSLIAGVLVATLVRSENSPRPVEPANRQRGFTRRLLRLLDFDHDYEISTFDVAISGAVAIYMVLLVAVFCLLFFLSSNIGADAASLSNGMTRATTSLLGASYLKRSKSMARVPASRRAKLLALLDVNQDGYFTILDAISTLSMLIYVPVFIIAISSCLFSPLLHLPHLVRITNGFSLVVTTVLLGVYFGENVKKHTGVTKKELLFNLLATILAILFGTLSIIFIKLLCGDETQALTARTLILELCNGLVYAVGELLVGIFLKRRIVIMHIGTPQEKIQ